MGGDGLSVRLYRLLLLLFPKSYRAQYGRQMEQAFADMRREERYARRGGSFRLWQRVLPDLVANAVSERWKRMGSAFSWVVRTGASFFGTVGKVLKYPKAFYEGIDPEEDLGRPVSFAVVCLCLATGLGAVVSYVALRYEDLSLLVALAAQETIAAKMGIVVLVVLFGVLSAVITLSLFSAVVHLLVVLFMRSNDGFEVTLRVSAYASAALLLSWVPFVGWLATLYGLYVIFVGLQVLHADSRATRPVVTTTEQKNVWQ